MVQQETFQATIENKSTFEHELMDRLIRACKLHHFVRQVANEAYWDMRMASDEPEDEHFYELTSGEHTVAVMQDGRFEPYIVNKVPVSDQIEKLWAEWSNGECYAVLHKREHNMYLNVEFSNAKLQEIEGEQRILHVRVAVEVLFMTWADTYIDDFDINYFCRATFECLNDETLSVFKYHNAVKALKE